MLKKLKNLSMLYKKKKDKILYLKKGYIIKDIFSNDIDFLKITDELKSDINFNYNKNYSNLKKLGGFKSGNLNFISKLHSNKIIKLLNKNNFKNYFNFITNDDIQNYKIILGGNLNLPNSKNQFFHTDGNWNPRMIIVNIATSDIDLKNGPTEIIESSHKKNIAYWKFALKVFFLKKRKIFLKKGQIIFREHRLWHRGTSNKTKKIREMIGIMFIKNKSHINISIKKKDNKIFMFSNIFRNSKKERLKEHIFLKFRSIFFLYKFLVSVIK